MSGITSRKLDGSHQKFEHRAAKGPQSCLPLAKNHIVQTACVSRRKEVKHYNSGSKGSVALEVDVRTATGSIC